jgi:penicillin amidase
MRWVRRVTAGLAILVVLAVVSVSIFGVVAVRRSFPTVAGTLDVAGLQGPVTVERDADGVPTIIASSVEDLFLAQGFVHAQDRYWEMDLRRHITAGRLSELFGASQLDTDTFIRTLGWRRVAEAELELLRPSTRVMLDAYARGVNAWSDGRRGAALSLEHALLPLGGPRGYRPEPWGEADSLAWLKAMAWDLRSNMESELERGRLLASDLGEGRAVADLFPDFDPATYPTILPWGGGVVDDVFVPATGTEAAPTGRRQAALPAARPTGGSAELPLPQRAALAVPDIEGLLAHTAAVIAAGPALLGEGAESGIGSNSWVIGPGRTASGLPLLANDPHLAPSQPSLWYQVRLRCAPVTDACPYDVAGFSFAGVPGIVIGHNDTAAWGFTNLGPDVADLVVERIQGGRAVRAAGSEPIQVREEVVRIAGQAPRTITIRSTSNGPLLSDVSRDVRELGEGPLTVGESPADADYAVALRWVALDPAPTADAIPGLMAARTFEQFRQAAASFEVPSQNLVYADINGHIGYQAPGRIPVRIGHDGTLPVAGWMREAAWQRFLAFDELPYVLDPPSDFIATANQLVLPPGSSPFLHVDVSYGQRGARIVELLGDRRDLTVADMALVQMDNHNANAATLTPYLLGVRSEDTRVLAIQQLLAAWNFQDDTDSAAAAAFNATWSALLARTFHDELPEWAWPNGGGRWWEIVRALLTRPEDAWWHDDGLQQRQTRDDVLLLAMVDAHDQLQDLIGPDPSAWRWGAIHTLTLRHGTFGSSGIGLIERLFNRGPLETAGGTDIVNSNSWDATEGFEVVWVPSMRMIVDLADLDAGSWVHLTGQSGRPFHPHYVDQAERWRDGLAAPKPFTPAATAAASVSRLTLRPVG